MNNGEKTKQTLKSIGKLIISLLAIVVAVYGFKSIAGSFMSMIGGPCTSVMASKSIGCHALGWLISNMYVVWVIHIVVFGAVMGMTRRFDLAVGMTVLAGMAILPLGLLTTEMFVDVFHDPETSQPYPEGVITD